MQNNWKHSVRQMYQSLGQIRRRQWQPTPVLLPGKSHGQRSLVGCSPWGREESDTTERLHFDFSLSCIGEGNGNPLQSSCLENPKDGEAWQAAVCGVAQSRTRLKRLSSSSSKQYKRRGYFCKNILDKIKDADTKAHLGLRKNQFICWWEVGWWSHQRKRGTRNSRLFTAVYFSLLYGREKNRLLLYITFPQIHQTSFPHGAFARAIFSSQKFILLDFNLTGS